MPGVLGIVGTAFALVNNEMQKATAAAIESAKEDAKLEAVLLSTGYAAGMKADQLDALATSISKNIGMDDELVKAGESVLLTFTNIGEKVFPDTMRAAADMAAVIGGDLNGKITMIGKAMNDFDGYIALKRSGVVFSDEQVNQIKNFEATNDLMGYQALVLKELQREYGGAAKAINDAGDGSENFKIIMEGYYEEVGRSHIPVQKEQNKWYGDLFTKLTATKKAANDKADAMRELGIFYNQATGYIKDNVSITIQEAEAIISAYNSAEIASDRFDKMSGAIDGVGASAETTEAQLQEMNQTSKDMLSMTEKLTSIDETYKDGLQRVADTEYKTADERIAALKEVEKEHELATRKIVLGYTEQLLAADGLTQQEVEFLLEKGEQWGIYSDIAIEEMKSVMSEASNLASSINAIPSSKDITITTYHNDVYNGASGVTGNESGAGGGGVPQREIVLNKDLNGNGVIGAANGADFWTTGPQMMVVGEGGQSEHVQVTPASKAGGATIDKSQMSRLEKLLMNNADQQYQMMLTMQNQIVLSGR